MKRLLTLAILMTVFTLSCSQKPIREESGLVSVDQFKVHFPTENIRLRGVLSLDHLAGDLSGLDYAQYRDYLEKLKIGSEEVLKTLDEAEEHLFESSGADFIVCLRSRREAFVACDNSETAQLDQIVRGNDLPDLEELRSKIR